MIFYYILQTQLTIEVNMFLGQLEICRLWIFLINIRMENNGITSETLTKKFASSAAKNSKISGEIKRGSFFIITETESVLMILDD